MPYGLYISAEGADAQSRRLEILSNNLANVDTIGFKRDLAMFQARYAEATEQGLDEPGSGSLNDLGGGVLFRATETEYSQGPLKETGIPTDMAIQGEGFFAVQKGDTTYLTRAGNFKLDAEGTLTTQQGYTVLSDSGQPIRIDVDLGRWEVTPDGGIKQGGTINAFVGLVRPESLSDLVKAGENLFLPRGETAAVEANARRVRSGFVEGSGVKPTLAMMELIETSRAYEANTTMIRNQDEMMGSLIDRVLSA